MESKIPNPIKDIVFLEYEIKNCDFEVHQNPAGGIGGYINTKVDHSFNYSSKKIMVLDIRSSMNAYTGKIAEMNIDEDPLIFSLNIGLQIRYLKENNKSTPSQIKRYEWHFKSHASILLNNISRDILKDTRFRTLERTYNSF